jgi:hypothetical protein
MKFLFFIFIILISTISLVQATGFSPSSLIYELEKGEEECKMITITSDSEQIAVSDNWAENVDVEWKVSLFETDASTHGISIDYNDALEVDEREVEVCLSGSNVGEYHGVMLLKQGQEGNSIVQMGVWLKVTIAEPETITSPSNNDGGSSSGGGGAISAKVEVVDTEEDSESEGELVVNTDEISEGENSPITGAVIGGIGNTKMIGIGLVVIIIAGLIIYNQKSIKERLRKTE